MTSPVEDVIVECPQCGHTYKDWVRRSVNLTLDNFDDEYLDQCSSATCPACGHKVYFSTMVVKDGNFYISE
ncbi:MAG TPA: hypothetical protein VM409_04225 [Chloroflexia bacterium]|nr:hypothetical protein [Chloroflexia bacterium]